jgi:hypothetical protein
MVCPGGEKGLSLPHTKAIIALTEPGKKKDLLLQAFC